MMRNIWANLSKIIDFLKTDIWRMSLKDISRKKSFIIKQLRTILLAIRGFDENRCLLRASSLTFYSLLSIVPVLAMAFGIAKGFGFEKLLEKELYERLPGQEQVISQFVDFAKAALENTRGGMIAGIGVILLLWSVIKLLGHIESSFNEIWEIRKPRTAVRKLSDYLSIMLIGPVFLVLANSSIIFISTQVTYLAEKMSLLRMFGPLIMLGLNMLPYVLIGLLLTIVYILMPNTKVNVGSGLVAGMIAGATYVVVQWGYISFQVGIAKYNAIYGSFAAPMLFLIWLQISWLIVLFGAEISFAIQNVNTYEFEEDCQGISMAFKRLISLEIACLLTRTFSKGEKPLTASVISNKIEAPIRLVHNILYELTESGIIIATNCDDPKEPAYQPARDISLLAIKDVIEALENRGSDKIPVARSTTFKTLSHALDEFGTVIENTSANKRLKEI